MKLAISMLIPLSMLVACSTPPSGPLIGKSYAEVQSAMGRPADYTYQSNGLTHRLWLNVYPDLEDPQSKCSLRVEFNSSDISVGATGDDTGCANR